MILTYDMRGAGPLTVVLLHGFPFNRSMWRQQVMALEGSYRVIVPDLRGFGASGDPGDRVFAIDAMADDVLETLALIGVDGPVVMGGLSMGGYLAQSIAVRAPERLRALILLDTKAVGDTPEAAEVRHKLADEMEASGDLELVVRTMVPKLLAPTTRQTSPEVVAKVEAMIRGTTPRVIAATSRGLAERPDRTADLPNMTMPSLVVVGEADAISPVEEARAIAESLPDARLEVVPGAGHLAPMEKPEAVSRAILEFLRGLT